VNKDIANAEVHYALAHQLDPSVTTFIQYACFRGEIGQLDSALHLFQEALAQYPTDPTLHHSYANFLVNLATNDTNKSKYNDLIQKANNHYQQAVQHGSNKHELLLDYANFLREILQDHKKAKAYMQSYQKLNKATTVALQDSFRVGFVKDYW